MIKRQSRPCSLGQDVTASPDTFGEAPKKPDQTVYLTEISARITKMAKRWVNSSPISG